MRGSISWLWVRQEQTSTPAPAADFVRSIPRRETFRSILSCSAKLATPSHWTKKAPALREMVKFNTSDLLFVRKLSKESQLICRCPRNSLVIAEPASQWVEGFLKHYNVQSLSMRCLQKYLISAILDKLKQIRRRGKLYLRTDSITRILQTFLKYKICKTLDTRSQIHTL